MTGNTFGFSSNQPTLPSRLSPPPPAENSSPSSFDYKRPFDTAFYPSTKANFNDQPPQSTSSYQAGYSTSRGGYSNSFRGGSSGSGYNRFPKRSRPYNYQN